MHRKIRILEIQPTLGKGVLRSGCLKLVVANDEWQISNYGFSQSPDARGFAQNIARWLGGCAGRPHGRFHAYSGNFSLTEAQLSAALQAEGHHWTYGTDLDVSLANLLTYDWIFLAGPVPNLPHETFIEYVKQGGGLYIAAGTGAFSGGGKSAGAQSEANAWNPILRAFGMQYRASYNRIKGNIPINSHHTIFDGVSSLYQNNGNTIELTSPPNQKTRMLINHSDGQGLYAIYDGSL